MRGIGPTLRRMGYGNTPMPIPEPFAHEGNCRLCGSFTALNRLNHCGRRECTGLVLERLREMAEGEDIPGVFFDLDGVEVVIWEAVEEFAEELGLLSLFLPEPNGFKGRDPFLCVRSGCEAWARSGDTLCLEHRAQQKREVANAQRKRVLGKARRQKGRDRSPKFNGLGKIRGLDKVKL